MPTAAEMITKARANLIMAHPFFGALALRLKLQEKPEQKELSNTDGTTIFYNPKEVEKLPQSKVQGMVAHAVMHPALLHHTRRGNRDIGKWNRACDYSINGMLQNAGFDLPEGGCVNPAYNGMAAEEIYTLIPDDDKDDDGDSPGGAGASPPNQDPGGDGGVSDSPGSGPSGSESQQREEEADWKMSVAQAAHVAKQAGKLPGEIERMIDQLLEPTFPWKQILHRFMTERASAEQTWSRPNRRLVSQGIIMPSDRSVSSGEIAVCIDTSGSIGQKELNEFGAEIIGIVEELGPTKTHVIYCDSRIAHVDTFEKGDDVEFAIHGGGGTDFRPPFEWLAENNINPRCVVYLTDGYGPFPEEEPEWPTLWVINNENVVPPHGEHLVLEVS